MVSMSSMVGIDVSKAELVCSHVQSMTQKTLWHAGVKNNPAGIKRLLECTPADVAWVVEPTGRYSQMVVGIGQEAGRQVLLAPTRKARAFCNSLSDRVKTDKVDSRGLALFGLSRALTKPLLPYVLKEGSVDEMEQLLSARRGLARSLAALQQQAGELAHAREHLEKATTALQEQIDAIDKEIATLVKKEAKFASAREMMKAPGIGPVTAAASVARLSSKGFAHSDQWVAYIGLDIKLHDSGKHKGKQALSHEGDAELRRLYYLCAQASIRAKESPFRAQYERELAKGLSTTAALCAVARKMARMCWALHHHGCSYDAERIYTAPTPASVAKEVPAAAA